MKKSSRKGPSAKPCILIIGAGLGGLALAQGLTQAGFKVRVFERDETSVSRPQGYRITMRSLGMTALAALLPPERMNRLCFAKIADVGDGFTFANEEMKPLLRIPPGQDAAVQLLRSELRALLQEEIDIVWNKRLINFEDLGHQVIAHFEDGSQATGDFMVGCDGGASIIREFMPSVYGKALGHIPQIINIDSIVFAGQIDRTPEWEKLLPLNEAGMVRYLGPAANYLGVCFSERADRSPTVFWGITEKREDRGAPWPQFDDGLDCRKRILDHCRDLMNKENWHNALKTLVMETPAEGIMAPWILRTTQFPNEFCHHPIAPTGRVTLLGDSAHSMPPGQGLGGSNVLEDARLLTALMSASPQPLDWPQLTKEYERQMFERARKMVQDSNQTAEAHHRIRELGNSKQSALN